MSTIPTTVAPNFFATQPASTVSSSIPSPRDEITTIEFSPTHDGVSCTELIEKMYSLL